MARLHADSVIRTSYVREVCRLLKASNINIVKNDIEFQENQEEMNRDVFDARVEEQMKEKPQRQVQHQESNDLFVSKTLPR